MKFFNLFIFMILFSFNASAQYGCYVESNGKIYTVQKPNGVWRANSGSSIGYACPSGSTSNCDVTNGLSGEEGDFSPVNCPLDTDIWGLILSSAAIGGFFILRKGRLNIH